MYSYLNGRRTKENYTAFQTFEFICHNFFPFFAFPFEMKKQKAKRLLHLIKWNCPPIYARTRILPPANQQPAWLPNSCPYSNFLITSSTSSFFLFFSLYLLPLFLFIWYGQQFYFRRNLVDPRNGYLQNEMKVFRCLESL